MNKISRFAFLSVPLIFFPILQAFAFEGAGGVRGGGEVFGDALNPWFLENTSTVTYCIEVDTQHFHLPAARIAALVENAVNDWKSAFQTAPKGAVEIATQQFVREECRSSTLLRFQFGIYQKSSVLITFPNLHNLSPKRYGLHTTKPI